MGQRVIPCAVTAEYVAGDGVTLGAAGSHNSVVVEYDFRAAGPQWEGTSKYVLWTNPQGNSTNRINLSLDELVDGYEDVYHAAPPADAMCVPGWAEMVVVGYTLSDGQEITRIKTEPSRFRVLPGSSRAADNEGLAATVADQLQADIEALGKKKVDKPVPPYNANGAEGQLLQSLGDGRTRWVDGIPPTLEQVEEVLEDHPEWTTTVQDGAITQEKLAEDLASKLGYVTPQMFGAVGDGVTDDTEAFQQALNAGSEVFVPFDQAQVYRITDTLSIPQNCKKLFGAGTFRMGASIMLDLSDRTDEPGINLDDVPLFSVTREYFNFYGLHFTCKAVNGSRVGVFLDASNHATDKDLKIDYCFIGGFNKNFKLWGRGFEVINSTVASTNYLADIDWDENLDTNNNHPNRFGQRGICFKNNRLHSIGVQFLHVKSGHAYGLVFQDNTIDNGRGNLIMCADEAWNWTITGNLAQTMVGASPTKTCMLFTTGMKDCVISGNVFSAEEDYWTDEAVPEMWLRAGTAVGCVVSSNLFGKCTSHAIFLNYMTGCVVSNNACHDIAMNATDGATKAMLTFTSGDTVSIVGNAVSPYNENGRLLNARSGSSKLDNSKVIGNTCPNHQALSALAANSEYFVTDEEAPS